VLAGGSGRFPESRPHQKNGFMGNLWSQEAPERSNNILANKTWDASNNTGTPLTLVHKSPAKIRNPLRTGTSTTDKDKYQQQRKREQQRRRNQLQGLQQQ
jgi:hypothetical protein